MTFLAAPLFWGITLVQFILMLISTHGTYLSQANGQRHPSTHALWLVFALVFVQLFYLGFGALIVSGLTVWFVIAPVSKYLVVGMWRSAGYDPFTGRD